MKYSEITYTYNGGDTIFGIPFEYIKKDFIFVFVNENLLDNDYEIENQSVILNIKLEPGTKIKIQRKTDLKELVDFTSRNNLKSYDLNLAFTQMLHVMQEQYDFYNDLMTQTFEGNWNAQNKKIVNLAPAENDTDAVRKDQIISENNFGDWNAKNKRIVNLAPAIDDCDVVRKDQIISLAYDGMEELEKDVDSILEGKGKPNGYASLDNSGHLQQEQKPFDFVRFCVNSGLVDESGNANLLQYNSATKIITVKSPFVYTTLKGITYTVEQDLSISLPDNQNSTLRIFVNRNTQNEFFLEVFTNTIFEQNTEPNNAKESDFWIDTSIAPEKELQKKVGKWEDSEAVEIGYINFIDNNFELKVNSYNGSSFTNSNGTGVFFTPIEDIVVVLPVFEIAGATYEVIS